MMTMTAMVARVDGPVQGSDTAMIGDMKKSVWLGVAALALLAAPHASLETAQAPAPTAVPETLPGTLRDHLKKERFEVITSLRGLPLGVREALQTLFGSQTLDIAEPGAEFQATEGTGESKLPRRRLLAAGCSPDHHCLVYYERGGSTRTWRVALFQWTPAATRFEWGGNARGGLATIEDVRNAVLAGAVKGPVTVW
jgi:hypothetical protein